MESGVSARLIICGYGRPALVALRDTLVAAKGGDALAPVTVVVASNPIGVATRRRLAAGVAGPVSGQRPGLAAVTFLTPYRLAELLGSASLASAGRRPVSTPVLAVTLRRVLAEQPGIFAPVAAHPTTEARLIAAHRELSEVSAAALDRLAAQSARSFDVVRIHRALRARLRAGWYEEQDLAEAACALVGTDPTALVGLGPLVVYLPIGLKLSQARLLRVAAGLTDFAVVAAMTGIAGADEPTREALSRLGLSSLLDAEEGVEVRAEPGDEPAAGSPAGLVQVISVSDPDDEVRHAIRGVAAAMVAGIPLDRMAIVTGAEVPYTRLVHEQLAAAGIPANGTAVNRLSGSLAGRTILGLLDLTERGFRREDVLGLLASSPFRWRGGLVPSRAWEVLSRRAGVVRGVADWQERLARLDDDLAEAARRAEVDAEERDWRVARIERDRERVRSLAAFVADLAAELAFGASARSWSALAGWARQLIREHLGTEVHRAGWPEPQQRAADKVEEILDRLAGLDTISTEPGLDAFTRTLRLELDAGLGRIGRLGDGILVTRPSLAAGLELDRVWALGLAEGTFPSRSRDDSLLPDRERRVVGSELGLRADRLHEEHRQLLAILAGGAEGEVTLLHPRGDLRATTERAPSRWLEGACGSAPVEESPSFAGALLAAPLAATSQERNLQALVAAGGRGGALRQLVEADPRIARGAALLRARSGPDFTRFDGNLGHVTLPDPTDPSQVWSATRLETWAKCPHQYFLRYLLGVEPVDLPELRLRIDALDRGTLVHRILERFVAETLARPEGPPEPSEPWHGSDGDRLLAIAAEELAAVEAAGQVGARLYWRRDSRAILADLVGFLAEDSGRRAMAGARPLATELAFGSGAAPTVRIDLSTGRSIVLRGSIDRVDSRSDGGYLVTDYKTGRPLGPKDLTAEAPHDHGTKLQLAIYAAAVRQLLGPKDAAVMSHYWYATRRGGYAARGYSVQPGVMAAVIDAIATIVAGIAAGVFPQHPDSASFSPWISCDYCDPDGLGVGAARRRFLRKALAPELEAYIGLAEPELLPDPPLDPQLGAG